MADKRKMPELLAPAGDMERLKMAVLYGADAVYLAGTSFGMRAFAGNFAPEELKTAVDFAHAHGVSVEAELGHVGQAAEGDGRSDDMYTKVDMAVEFVERTGCDMLAVAIGTAHGKYPADYVPTLDFDRLAEIKKALGEKYPLVLHGGSGAGDENFKKAVAGGINKVNLWTDYGRTYVNAMRDFLAENESPDYIFVTTDAEEKAAKWLERYMDLFGSSNRYQFSDDKMVETD